MSVYGQGVPGWENLHSVVEGVGTCSQQKSRELYEPRTLCLCLCLVMCSLIKSPEVYRGFPYELPQVVHWRTQN